MTALPLKADIRLVLVLRPKGDIHTKLELGKHLASAATVTALIIIGGIVVGFVWFSAESQAYSAEEMRRIVIWIAALMFIPILAVVWLILLIWDFLNQYLS
jgi:heme/copper-type cytochrome/quinol oxidase subunit 2